jgi:cytochrome P450
MDTALDVEFRRFAQDPFQDPDAFYDRLRSTAPVYQTPLGYWFITRHDLAVEVLRDDRRFANNPSAAAATATPEWVTIGGPASRIFQQALVFLDGETHDRLRALVRTVFAPRFIKQYGLRMRATVDRLLDEAAAMGAEGDFLADYASLLPTTVILELIGLSQAELGRFHELAYHFLAKHFPIDVHEWAAAADPVVVEVERLILDLAARRRKHPTDDLLSALANAEASGDHLSDDELVAMIMFLVIAGYETTANTLTNGIYDLLRHPAQWARLKADPTLVSTAADEILRFDGSTRNSPPRFALEDVEIGGELISKGDRVYVCLHAADRDPVAFIDPLSFDIGRSPNPHIVFSQGVHYCLGHALARLEMTLSLEAILTRFPDLELIHPVMTWKNHFVIRGFDALPVRWQQPSDDGSGADVDQLPGQLTAGGQAQEADHLGHVLGLAHPAE